MNVDKRTLATLLALHGVTAWRHGWWGDMVYLWYGPYLYYMGVAGTLGTCASISTATGLVGTSLEDVPEYLMITFWRDILGEQNE